MNDVFVKILMMMVIHRGSITINATKIIENPIHLFILCFFINTPLCHNK